ncbi:MAG TPA: isomerizing glutamine--fructose-6-phosphate transaminase, partial [candidate division Zixibacteria bacterium]|nr:isomerizing glutamine--fructose-6-phosphate transaminase [candidate division Zixibacteria bacterium]
MIHNGIIENYKTLREVLAEKGHIFRTETDTEVLAHLIEENYDGDLLDAVREALTKVEGTYGIAVLHEDNPEEIIAARRGSPILIARGEKENFVASDAAAVLRHTNQVVYLEDKEVARVRKDGFSVSTINKVEVTPKLEEISWSLEEAEKEGFSHFMQKEIFEQPTTLENCLRGRLNFTDGTARLSGLHLSPQELADIDRIIITACGTSWHSALVGEYMLEEIARIPVEVEYASEFRYRSPVVNPGTIVFAISQSGETADTSAAQREAKSRGAKVLAICNVVGSTIAREASGGLYIHAGPEIGVASTKAFTGQVMTLALITLLLGRIRTLSLERGREFITELQKIPG